MRKMLSTVGLLCAVCVPIYSMREGVQGGWKPDPSFVHLLEEYGVARGTDPFAEDEEDKSLRRADLNFDSVGFVSSLDYNPVPKPRLSLDRNLCFDMITPWGPTPALHRAVQSGSLDDIRESLKGGYDINTYYPGILWGKRDTALSFALELGDKDKIRFLLSKGADPNIEIFFGGHFSMLKIVHDIETLELLCQHGAEVTEVVLRGYRRMLQELEVGNWAYFERMVARTKYPWIPRNVNRDELEAKQEGLVVLAKQFVLHVESIFNMQQEKKLYAEEGE